MNILPDMSAADFFVSRYQRIAPPSLTNRFNNSLSSDFRHESVLSTHLPTSQFVMHLDADCVVLDLSHTIDRFLTSNSSVLLQANELSYLFNRIAFSLPYIAYFSVLCVQMRENYEVTSAVYIVRNDRRARCFLNYWRAFHPPRTPQDQGSTIIPGISSCYTITIQYYTVL